MKRDGKFCRSINNVVYVGRHTSDIIKQLALHQQEEDEGKKTKQREFIEKQVEIQRSGLHSIIVEGMLRSLGKQVIIIMMNMKWHSESFHCITSVCVCVFVHLCECYYCWGRLRVL